MQRRTLLLAALAIASSLAPATGLAQGAELRVITHNSFSLPKPLLAQFEAQAGVRLAIVKAGDAGEMLNKLILTRAQPIADVVFGLDNASIAKAARAGVIDAYTGPAATRAAVAELGFGAVPVDYGYVTLNIDLAWFARQSLAAPASLEDLTRPDYRKLVVVQNPATSSPGFAFLASTIAAFGEDAAFDWWKRLRDNEVKVAKGWSEAYYTDFTRNGGTRPIVVSYASSPAAEVFYSKTPLADAPTRSLSLRGAVFRQVEAVALVKGGAQREAAGQFIEFLRSAAVQEGLQTSMWMLPVEPAAVRADVMRRFAPEPDRFDNPTPDQLSDRAADWVQRWTRVVLR